jgi:hypothetical protein
LPYPRSNTNTKYLEKDEDSFSHLNKGLIKAWESLRKDNGPKRKSISRPYIPTGPGKNEIYSMIMGAIKEMAEGEAYSYEIYCRKVIEAAENAGVPEQYYERYKNHLQTR